MPVFARYVVAENPSIRSLRAGRMLEAEFEVDSVVGEPAVADELAVDESVDLAFLNTLFEVAGVVEAVAVDID